MKKIHIITKSIWTIFLIVLEIGLVTSLLVYISQFLRPVEDGFDLIERYILFFAVYEIFVYITLSFLNDAQCDSLLTLRTAYEQALFYFHSGEDDKHKEILLEKIQQQLLSTTFNNLGVRAEYELLVGYMDTKNVWAIKYKSIMIGHSYEMCSLQWKLTFLLRIFK